MKVTLGMRVRGEVAEGIVVAMSKYWCIYETGDDNGDAYGGSECAEPWTSIEIVASGPAKVVSSVKSKEIK